MESDIPRYNLTVDYKVGEGFGENLLGYKNVHCKIEAGFFILCTKGTIQATINGNHYNIVENDLITLPPNYFMEIHEFSSDIHIYYAGFCKPIAINCFMNHRFLHTLRPEHWLTKRL